MPPFEGRVYATLPSPGKGGGRGRVGKTLGNVHTGGRGLTLPRHPGGTSPVHAYEVCLIEVVLEKAATRDGAVNQANGTRACTALICPATQDQSPVPLNSPRRVVNPRRSGPPTEHAMFHPGRLRHACTRAVGPKAH